MVSVIYPGDRAYPLAERVKVTPVAAIGDALDIIGSKSHALRERFRPEPLITA